MDYVQNELLKLTAVRVAMETGKVSQVSGPKPSEPRDEFRRLMKESRRSEEPRKEEPKPAGKQEQTESSVPGESPELEQQMSLAAMAILYPVVQPRVVLAEQPQTQEAVPQLELQTQGEILQPQTQPQVQTRTAGAQGGPELTMVSGENPAESLTGDGVLQKEQPVEMTQVPGEEKAPDAVPVGKQLLIEKSEGAGTEKPRTDLPNVEQDKPEVRVLDAGQAAEQPLFRELEAVPVKVGEARTGEKQPQPVSGQLDQRISRAIQEGESRVELELEPRSLGKVRIELTMQQDGSLHVLLRAEKPATQVLLDRGTGELQGLLGRDTRQEVLVETGRYQEEQSQLLDRDPQQGQQGRQDTGDREQNQRQNRDQNESFFQQLRLGLTSTETL